MNKHTKGPWVMDKRMENLVGVDGKRVCVYGSGLSFQGLPDPESVANAKLIAAAPEMLEALKKACLIMQREIPWDAEKEIREVIRKAEGQ